MRDKEMIYAGATACCLGSSFVIGIVLIAMCNNGDACGPGQKTIGEALLTVSSIVTSLGCAVHCLNKKDGAPCV